MNLLAVCVLLALSQFDSTNAHMTVQEILDFENSTAKPLMEKGRTIVWYNGTLHCNTPGFCATIYYEEDDTVEGGDEALVYVGLHCTKTTKLHHSVMVIYEDGDGWFDNHYEPMIGVVHDCATWRQQRKVKLHLPAVKDLPEATMYHLDYTRNLTAKPGPMTNMMVYNMYYTHWGYVEDKLTLRWLYGKDMSLHPELYEQKILYWEIKNVWTWSYEACLKSTAHNTTEQTCKTFSKYSHDMMWEAMLHSALNHQKK